MTIRNLTISTALLTFALSSTALAADNNEAGETQQCIPLQNIDETRVIDNKTILVEMKGGGYKRIDLLNNCVGLKIAGGFSYSTSINQLCKQDPLRVVDSINTGATCMIDQIVTISEDEADELIAKR